MKWRNLGVLFFEAHERITESLIAAFAFCCFKVDKKEIQQYIYADLQRYGSDQYGTKLTFYTSNLLQCNWIIETPFCDASLQARPLYFNISVPPSSLIVSR